MANIQGLESICKEVRVRIIEQSNLSDVPHLGSCLSCVEILVSLYWEILSINPAIPNDPQRDRFILSKGHAAPALFQILGMKDFYSLSLLSEFNRDGSLFGEHPPAHGIPGIEAATGSLGHGLPIGLGMALSAKMKNQSYKTYVLLSDGECNEGSVWEAAMMASAQKVENLVAIIDFNKWQATGRSEEILSLNPLKEKWKSFGWSAYETDGHDLTSLLNLLKKVPDGSGKPIVIVAHTIKGKGVSFMEDDNNWHYKIPNEKEVAAAKLEIGANQ